MMLRRLSIDVVLRERRDAASDTSQSVASILGELSNGGEASLWDLARRFDGRDVGATLCIDRDELAASAARVEPGLLELLQRCKARISAFAEAQLACLTPLRFAVPGGHAGHDIAPVERVGCYAPSGRHPLPTSVLMTVVTARVAGVRCITLATPRPDATMLAAAHVAGADRVLACGGAHAIGALAFGIAVPRVDVVCGPGNAYVTEAKRQLSGHVGIDMLAGPSELIVIADANADPARVAADLLAQAEHDPLALPLLVTTDASVIQRVELELDRGLAMLPTRDVARAALSGRGGVLLCADFDEVVAACNAIAPEHLVCQSLEAERSAHRFAAYGALFTGKGGEVFGDYGVGPNHVLPTGGSARHTGGLSVFSFLRVRNWLHLDSVPPELRADTLDLARLEGLPGHARAADLA